MNDKELDDFVELLKNPRRDWPTYFTPEDLLCRWAAEAITKLRKKNKGLKKQLQEKESIK